VIKLELEYVHITGQWHKRTNVQPKARFSGASADTDLDKEYHTRYVKYIIRWR
jgi:hypothetical protein